MKSYHLRPPLGRRVSTSRGFSLIIVLLFLVLLTVLILSFFAGVTSDLSTTTAYANDSGTRQLSDNVIQLMEGQIKDATTAPVDISGNTYGYPNKPFAWASQPGMIRTYDTTGAGLMFYKLYSSDNMRAVWNDQGAYQTSLAHDLSTSDMADPSQFTDLNSPVNNSAGNQVYPIADPNALPALAGANGVRGFSVSGAPTDVAGVNYGPNSLPMPVRWLYKLQDGTLVAAPSGGKSGTVDLSGSGASASNPIVGRVAFWTDDETSKVNINTAAEGTYWDTPRFDGTTQATITPNPPLTSATVPYPDPDYALAMSQPLKYEFQRYPGHPAQVALSPIFPQLLTQYSTPQALANAMAQITPFLAVGGSEGGTLTIPHAANQFNGALRLAGAKRQSPYASVDEFLYSTGMSGAARALTDTSASQDVITPTTLQYAKFFITANSRAPELNLFGQPRIACWPISSQFNLSNPANNAFTSIYDRLIAFCSSVKTAVNTYAPYYFQRNQPNPSQPNPLLPNFSGNDYTNISRNQTLYTYLQNLTGQAVPGFGGGGSGFVTKYPGKPVSDRDQILTEIFDYIRCTDVCDASIYNSSPANTFAASFTNAGTGVNDTYPITPIQLPNGTMGFGRVSVIDQVGLGLICIADGSSAEIDYGSANGGTSNTYQPGGVPASLTAPGNPATGQLIPDYQAIATAAGLSGPLQAGQAIVQAIWIMQGYVPGSAPPAFTPNYCYQVKGLSSITFTDANLNPSSPFLEVNGSLSSTSAPFLATSFNGSATYAGTELSPVHYCCNDPGGPPGPAYPGGDYMNKSTTFAYTSPPLPSSPTSTYYYPCISKPFVVAKAGVIKVSAGQIQICMLAGNTTNGKLNRPVPTPSLYGSPYQTFTFNFPTTQMTLAVPRLDTSNPLNWGFQHRVDEDVTFPAVTETPPISRGVGSYNSKLIGQKDSMKSFFLADHGDWRLINASPAASSAGTVPALDPTPIIEKGGGLDPQYSSIGVTTLYSNYFRDTTQLMANSNLDLSSSYIPGLPTPPGNQVVSGWPAQYQNVYPIDLGTPPPASLALVHVPVTPWSGDPTNNKINPKSQYCYMNGDFDNAPGYWPDGPQINKADEGDSETTTYAPYYNWFSPNTSNVSFSTPNRIMPSPGMFGSLSTGVISNTPWQTLLFRPQPTVVGAPANYYAHTEAAQPPIQQAYNEYTSLPDHLFLDLFWMPVVEPYAISDSFSTAGKINMNYQIEPFNYIDRSTSLIALLKAEKLIAVPDTADYYYKQISTSEPIPPVFRFPIYTLNANGTADETGGTLRQFRKRFDLGDIFRSASEICDIFLVPCNADGTPPSQTWTSDSIAAGFWATHRLTGDNSRERPYTNLYGRLTTKSNTFTIHMRVQSLKQSPADRAAGKWVESADSLAGEYRGSALIERYLDPSENNLPDYADPNSNPPAGNLDNLYKYRVVRTTQFTP